MKRLIGALLIMITLFSVPARAADDISVYLNGEKMTFDQPPIIRDDSTLVPFRAIFEKLGMTVQWFGEEKRVTAEKYGLNITLYINQSDMYVNNETVSLLTPPIIYNDYTMVPLRAVSEAAGAKVGWNGETRTVTINAKENGFEDWAQLVFMLVNAERLDNGLRELEWDDSLEALAKTHCEDMIRRDFFSHDNPDGETPFDRMKKANISYRAAGENIAAGQYSPKVVVDDWMASESHRENILNPKFKSTAVYVMNGGSYGTYWVQEFALFK